MDRGQLQPSRSAPDLTDLLEARSFEKRRLNNGTSDDDGLRGIEDDEDVGDNINDDEEDEDNAGSNRHRWRRGQLPTPSPSRSPTPDVSRNNDIDYGRIMEDADTYSFRLRSETPEVYSHRGHERMHRSEDDGEDEEEDANGLRRTLYRSTDMQDSQMTSESEGILRESVEDGSSSPPPSTPMSPRRPRGLSHVGTRFLPTSLWDYLREEISASELDGSQEMKAERVTNFFSVPMAVEQVSVSSLTVL